ncbi:MAG TPA: hypothetical protein PK071_06645, partial [Atopobiaceae bacterium]|nr:hypothetical protein [Atopobiaceae bacterium]
GERFPDTEEVTSSNLVAPTNISAAQPAYLVELFMLLEDYAPSMCTNCAPLSHFSAIPRSKPYP